MKKIQFYSLLFISFIVMMIGLIACTNDEAIVSDENKETSNFAGKTSDEGYLYAKAFYKSNLSFGKSVDVIDPDTKQGVTITEVKVNNEARARGYVVKQIKTDVFLFFADVNREKDVLTVYDAITDKQEIFSNLTKNEDYKTSEKFDFIKYANQKVTAVKGCGFWKKVWGSCTFHRIGVPVEGSPGYCADYSIRNTYFLGSVIHSTGWAPDGVYPCK